jgi:hypothetical protein
MLMEFYAWVNLQHFFDYPDDKPGRPADITLALPFGSIGARNAFRSIKPVCLKKQIFAHRI